MKEHGEQDEGGEENLGVDTKGSEGMDGRIIGVLWMERMQG
jgi:hypothetical protein